MTDVNRQKILEIIDRLRGPVDEDLEAANALESLCVELDALAAKCANAVVFCGECDCPAMSKKAILSLMAH